MLCKAHFTAANKDATFSLIKHSLRGGWASLQVKYTKIQNNCIYI